MLTLDGYGAHLSMKAIRNFRDNGIVAVALPAHSSHKTQVLDVSYFFPFKEAVKSAFHTRALQTMSERYARNDIYTLAEIVRGAYHKTLTMENIISGFEATGVWKIGGVDATVITESDFVTGARWDVEESQTPVLKFQELYDMFIKKVRDLLSDGTEYESGRLRVSTSGGATLTGKNVFNILQAQAESRQEDKNAQEIRKQETLARKEKRAEEEFLKKQRKKARLDARDEREEKELLPLRVGRLRTQSNFDQSRPQRCIDTRARAVARRNSAWDSSVLAHSARHAVSVVLASAPRTSLTHSDEQRQNLPR